LTEARLGVAADAAARVAGKDRTDGRRQNMTTKATSRMARPSTPLDVVPVRRVMHVGFVGCPFETPLRSVARLMAEHRVHCVVGFGDVTEDDTSLWGVVSDVDVVAALAAGGELTTAGEIASTEVVTIEPHESVRRAAELMRNHEVSHLLVVDRVSDRPIGIVSTLDVMALASEVATPRP
jgi:CBS domain-containing protein